MPKLLKTIVRLLLPNRFDVPAAALSLFLLAAIAVCELLRLIITMPRQHSDEVSFLIAFFPLSCFAIGLGAAFGSFWRKELRANTVWVGLFISVFFVSLWLLQREHLLSIYDYQLSDDSGFNLFPYWGLQLLVFALSWLGTIGTLILLSKSAKKFAGFKISRTKTLVIAAIVLFAIQTIQRSISGTTSANQGFGIGLNPIVGIALSIVAVWLLSALPAWLNERFHGWSKAVVLPLYFAVLFGSAFIQRPNWWIFLSPLLAIVVMGMLVGFRVYRVAETGGRAVRTISIWSVLFASIAGLALLTFLFLDFATLCCNLPNRFAVARQIKSINTMPGVEGHATTYYRGAGAYQIHVDLRMTPDSDRDCLKLLDSALTLSYVGLHNLNSSIETKHVRQLLKGSWTLGNSEVSAEQLSDLINGTSYFALQNCKVVDEQGTERVPERISQFGVVYVWEMPPGEFGKLLSRIDESNSAGQIYFFGSGQFSGADWKQILQTSRTVPITLGQPLSPLAVQVAIDQGGGAKLTANLPDSNPALTFKALLDSEIRFRSNLFDRESQSQFFWDAIFVAKGSLATQVQGNNYRQRREDAENEFQTLTEQNHWVFEQDENNNPRGLLVPLDGSQWIDSIATLTELETLSFDQRWLPALHDTYSSQIPTSSDLSKLARLTKLKRLDLSDGIFTLNLSFLQSLALLEHLQLDVFADGSERLLFTFSAEFCPQLKSLVLIGKPSKSLAVEIAKLPKLESLTIVDVDESLKQQDQRDQITSVIGDRIKLKFADLNGFVPELPSVFQEHLEMVRKHVREKYRVDDEWDVEN